MKRRLFYMLLFISSIGILTAQTQRMVLYEGFSNASCAPCASQNPTTNALINANPTKVVALKYQVNWPGVDPMNAQTQTWVGPRVSYYGVTGVPATKVDGTGSSITQAVIDNRYAVPSPFSMSITHSFNPVVDSVYVQVVVTAAQNYTGSSLVLHLAMIEKQISFATAPGSNGETNFYHVMRRMLPSASGTSLPSTWINTESQTFNFAAAIPNFIYDLNQLAFVAFIQSNTDKSILQAAKNNPTTFPLYPRIVTHNIPVNPTCSQNLSLQFTMKNMGSTTIDSFQVQYGVVGETPQYYNWTGSLTSGQQTVITLPQFTFTSNQPLAYIEIKNPNGSPAFPGLHARVERTLNYISNYSPVPVSQGFAATTFPPANWVILSDDDLTWVRHTAGGFGANPGGSAMMSFYDSPSNKIDYLYMEPINMSAGSNMSLSFSVAHARYDATYGANDRLQVEVSTNCGQSWVQAYNKAGATLATAPNTTAQFVPTAAQWRSETVDLNPYAGQSQVLVRFKATSGYGNNLYIDDISIIPSAVGIMVDGDKAAVNVYPNPVKDAAYVTLNLKHQTTVQVRVYNVNGQCILNQELNGQTASEPTHVLDTRGWAPGLYQVVVQTGEETHMQKLIKQ